LHSPTLSPLGYACPTPTGQKADSCSRIVKTWCALQFQFRGSQQKQAALPNVRQCQSGLWRRIQEETMSAQLITETQMEALIKNGKKSKTAQRRDQLFDPKPVVKLFTPDAQATWLLSEVDPDEPDIAFGLCDLGLGFPELGIVSLTEIKSVRGKLGLPVERDLNFKADRPLSEYAKAARKAERITA
jgi:Protein of unknown function (DUF2958)